MEIAFNDATVILAQRQIRIEDGIGCGQVANCLYQLKRCGIPSIGRTFGQIGILILAGDCQQCIRQETKSVLAAIGMHAEPEIVITHSPFIGIPSPIRFLQSERGEQRLAEAGTLRG